MNQHPTDARWTAQRAVDGNINQLYSSNSCAVTQLHSEHLWWKVWFNRIFNIAYLEVYLGSDSKYLYLQYTCLVILRSTGHTKNISVMNVLSQLLTFV